MSPHDALFKAAFRDLDAARSLLRVALPREVLEALDLSTLRVTEGSFVNDELRERFADLLLEVTSRGEPTLLHVLVEHKSQPARFTILDLFDSVAMIWKAWRRHHPEVTNLPRVLPIVLHHGNAAWNQPQVLADLFAGDAEVARIFAPLDPVFPVVFYDLVGTSDPEAAVREFDDPLAQCVMYLLLVSRLRDFVSRLDRLGFTLIARVWRGPNGEAWTPVLLEYVLTFAPQDTDPAEFVRMAGQYIDPHAENEMRSLKDALLDQGRRLGRDEGRREGLQEGTNLAILEILGSRFGDATETVRAPLMQIHDPAFLLRLVSVAMKAASIEAFERELRDG